MACNKFSTTSKIVQGCIISPCLFNLILHAILALTPIGCGAKIGEILVYKLAHADDADQLATTPQNLQRGEDNISKATNSFRMQINKNKT